MAVGLVFVTYWSQIRTVLPAITGCKAMKGYKECLLSGAGQAKMCCLKFAKTGFLY